MLVGVEHVDRHRHTRAPGHPEAVAGAVVADGLGQWKAGGGRGGVDQLAAGCLLAQRQRALPDGGVAQVGVAQAQPRPGGARADDLGGVARLRLGCAACGNGDRQAHRAHLVAGETIAERPSGLQAHVDGGVADAAAVDVDEAVGGEAAQAPLDGPMGGRRLDGDEMD